MMMLHPKTPNELLKGISMRLLSLAATTVALLAAVPADAATTITFDTLPSGTALPASGTTIGTQYQSLGVTFSGSNTIGNYTGPLNAWGLIQATGPAGSGNYLGSFGAIPPGGPSNYLLAPRYDVMSLLFADTASAISFGLSAARPGVTINAYGANGALLQSLAGVVSDSGFTLQTLSATNVARVDLVGTFSGTTANSARLFGIDTLTFTANAAAGAVPEPATWGMMILGFGMIGGAARSRKTSTRVTFA